MTVTEFINNEIREINDIYENPNHRHYNTWAELSTWEWKDYINDRLMVVVDKGRKWKGVGYLVALEEEVYYHHRNILALVYDPIENAMHKVTAKMVRLHPSYKENYRSYIEYILRTEYDDEASLPKGFGIDFHMSFQVFLHRCKSFIDIPKDVRYPEEEVRLEKLAHKKEEFKLKKFPELVKWAQSKGKVGEEAIALAEKVWQKHYA